MKIKFGFLNVIGLILFLVIFCVPCSYARLDKECISKLFAGGEVDLYGKYIGDDGAREIANILKKTGNITKLRLGENNISDVGVQALAESLVINTTLNTLDLRENDIGFAGSQALASSLIANNTLRVLDLEGNNIGDMGVQTLSEALRNNASLAELNTSFNNIGDVGARALAEGLIINTGLVNLNLEGNNISDEGMQTLAAALEANTTLDTIHLRLNGFSDASTQALVDAAMLNVGLNDIKIQGLSAKQKKTLSMIFIRNNLIARVMPAIRMKIFHILQIEKCMPCAVTQQIWKEFDRELNEIKALQVEIYTLSGWPIEAGLKKIGQYILSDVPKWVKLSQQQQQQQQQAEEEINTFQPNATDTQATRPTSSSSGLLGQHVYVARQIVVAPPLQQLPQRAQQSHTTSVQVAKTVSSPGICSIQ